MGGTTKGHPQMIRVPLKLHGTGSSTADVTIDEADDHLVSLTLGAEQPGDRPQDDRDVDRTLEPHEARAIACALWHFADQAER